MAGAIGTACSMLGASTTSVAAGGVMLEETTTRASRTGSPGQHDIAAASRPGFVLQQACGSGLTCAEPFADAVPMSPGAQGQISHTPVNARIAMDAAKRLPRRKLSMGLADQVLHARCHAPSA